VIIFGIILSLAILSITVYVVTISVFTIGWFRLKETAHYTLHGDVKVSVIVPFRNEENNIVTLMECLSRQYYPVDFLEVILVDDHSEDMSQKLVRDFIEVNELSNFKVLGLGPDDGISKKAALSKGIVNSIGQLIITTDADCSMGAFWVSSITEKYLAEKCEMISGPLCIIPGGGFFSRLQSLEFLSLIGCGAGAISIGKPFLANGANLAFSRSLYDELKGYSGNQDYASGDDVFMLLKAKQKHKIVFLKDKATIVYTHGAPGLKAFFHQRIRWTSKSSGYKDAPALITALSVLLMNTMIIISCGIGFFDSKLFFVSGLLFLIKLLVDLPLFIGVSGFSNLRKLMWFYFPMQLLYTIYIIATAILSWFIPFEWKNRSMRK
jgi:poly-beta-1,6-N-acetyl-D-glucosamine synthase